MKKLGKKLHDMQETIEAYCFCSCKCGPCTCSCNCKCIGIENFSTNESSSKMDMFITSKTSNTAFSTSINVYLSGIN